MFTGLIDHCGLIQSIQQTDETRLLEITCQFTDLQLGESIAVNGICLTVTEHGRGYFCCEASPETARVTTLDTFSAGMPVNLERALRLSDRLGGHFVWGHVDQVAELVKRRQDGAFVELEFTGISEDCRPLLVSKGSIAVDGVSLTINQMTSQGFQVMLVPHTLEKTNLKQLTIGSTVNIEFDGLVKMVRQQLTQ